jgi:hypothetical protein
VLCYSFVILSCASGDLAFVGIGTSHDVGYGDAGFVAVGQTVAGWARVAFVNIPGVSPGVVSVGACSGRCVPATSG